MNFPSVPDFHDQLNRLATAKTSSTTGTNCWGETFSYDIWANLLSIGAVPGYTGCTQENLSVTVTTSNRISGDTYDASGNLTLIPGTGGASYAYNAESQLTSANGISYTYDGDGRRVQKSSGKLYWYGMSSDALDETDLSGNLTNEYIFFGGKRIARRDASSNVFYYFEDHLGTSRVITNAAGAVCYDADFYPFGGERTPIVNSCPQNYKFTGKERDGTPMTETGLDNFGARYYSSTIGRFVSPDPSTLKDNRLENPHRWNSYAYAVDNPLTNVDPDGLDAQQFWANIKGTGRAIASAFVKSGKAYAQAAQKVAAGLSANAQFSFSHISNRDLNNIGANLTLILAGAAEGGAPELAAAAAGAKTFALDTSVLIDIEKGAVSASSFGGNLVISETAFKEFLAGTTPEEAAAFLKNNIAVQGIGDVGVYNQTLSAALKEGLSQGDAEILATAASNNTTLVTTDKSLLDVAEKLGIKNDKPR